MEGGEGQLYSISNRIVKVDVDATCNYFKTRCILLVTTKPAGTIWKDAKGTLTPFQGSDIMLNRIALSNSTGGKYAPMQVVKQPQQGRASTTEEQKCSSFQINYDS